MQQIRLMMLILLGLSCLATLAEAAFAGGIASTIKVFIFPYYRPYQVSTSVQPCARFVALISICVSLFFISS